MGNVHFSLECVELELTTAFPSLKLGDVTQESSQVGGVGLKISDMDHKEVMCSLRMLFRKKPG